MHKECCSILLTYTLFLTYLWETDLCMQYISKHIILEIAVHEDLFNIVDKKIKRELTLDFETIKSIKINKCAKNIIVLHLY